MRQMRKSELWRAALGIELGTLFRLRQKAVASHRFQFCIYGSAERAVVVWCGQRRLDGACLCPSGFRLNLCRFGQCEYRKNDAELELSVN